MKTDIQIRGVPEDVRDRVRKRAASQQRSMSDYLLDLIRRDLQFPTSEEFASRLARRSRVRLGIPAARLVQGARREREAVLGRGKRRAASA